MTSNENEDIVFIFFKDSESTDLMLAILETIPKKIELSEKDRFYGKTDYAFETPVKHFFRIKDK